MFDGDFEENNNFIFHTSSIKPPLMFNLAFSDARDSHLGLWQLQYQ